MAYVITNGSVLQVSLIGKHENQQVMSVFHYRASMAEPLADGAAAADAAFTLMNAAGKIVQTWRDSLSAKVVAIRGQVQWITPLRFAFIPREVAPGVGGVAGDAYPVNTAIAITKRTEFAGRDEVGTLHMPGVPMSFMENGELIGDGVVAYSLLGEKLLEVYNDEANSVEYFPILFHRANPTEGQQIKSYSVHPEARIMRRRTVGLGS